LKISRQGGVTISKDSQLDTGAVEKSTSDDENEAI
jgi:hypothetical protein